jgi:transposase InsO family protein
MVESFFSTLKNEWVHEPGLSHREEAQEVCEFIEVFANRQRLHQTFGYVSPVQFETHVYCNPVSMTSGVAHAVPFPFPNFMVPSLLNTLVNL